MKALYGCVHYTFKGIFKLLYHHQVYGAQNVFCGAAVIAPNHTSYFDPLFICASYPEEVHFMARESLFNKFFLSWIIVKLNAHPVNTDNPSDKTSIKTICKLLESGEKVVIFPEGVRSTTGELVPLKFGASMLALRCHSAVIPVYISGAHDIWPRDRRYPRLTGRSACVFGSPILWKDFQHLSRKAAQEAMTAKTEESIKTLREWYQNGAIGTVP